MKKIVLFTVPLASLAKRPLHTEGIKECLEYWRSGNDQSYLTSECTNPNLSEVVNSNRKMFIKYKKKKCKGQPNMDLMCEKIDAAFEELGVKMTSDWDVSKCMRWLNGIDSKKTKKCKLQTQDKIDVCLPVWNGVVDGDSPYLNEGVKKDKKWKVCQGRINRFQKKVCLGKEKPKLCKLQPNDSEYIIAMKSIENDFLYTYENDLDFSGDLEPHAEIEE